MDLVVYGLFRGVMWVFGKMSIEFAFRLGSVLGWLAWLLLPPYRKLAVANLTIAFGREKTPREIKILARRHFQNLGGNLLTIPKLALLSQEEIAARLTVVGGEHVEKLLAEQRGILWIGNHLGNWEISALAIFLFPEARVHAVYQRIGNPHIDRYIQTVRSRFGLHLLERKDGFADAIKSLREGGVTGVLIDQHAGDGGTWVPFFGRLASTTPLVALMAQRSGAAMVPLAVETIGIARWKWTFEPPLPDEKRSIPLTTALLNEVLERQIRRSPHEWFWVHERWKTPSPEFLLGNEKRYKRGIALLPGMTFADLQPFQILIRSSNWLGDAVMTVPAVRAIKHGRPDARVTILAKEKLVDFWKVVSEVDEIIPITASDSVWSVARKIRGRFDVAIVLPNSMRTALEVFLAGIPRRVAYNRQERSFLLNQTIRDPKKVAPPEHQSLHYLRLAKEIGADLDFASFPPRRQNKPYAPVRVGLCPGAEYGPAKRWLPERFAAVAQAVAQRRHCEWYVFGTKNEAALGEQIVALLPGSGKNYAGKTTLAELIALLEQCSALLTNDTGTMHLAALLGIPTISVFGSTEPVLTGPMGEGHRVIRHQVECSPCFLRECPIDFRCMNSIQVEEVVEAVLQAI